MKVLPRYPVYVISKGRFENCLTAKFLSHDKTPFNLVVETQEADQYAARFGKDRILVLPFSNLNLGSTPARNWVKKHATEAGHARHWILDDNIRHIHRRYKAERIICNSSVAFAAVEDFTDRYTNIAIAGLNYSMFAPDRRPVNVFFVNHHVYSCLLILNSIPQWWRGRYNEDTDLCLQVLAAGWCTVLVNAFLIQKMATMKMKGGNTDQLYKGDGRLKMARTLERSWPYVVTVDRRFGRPQHMVHKEWAKFSTQLIRRTDIDWKKLSKPNEYGLELKQVGTEIKSKRLRDLVEQSRKK